MPRTLRFRVGKLIRDRLPAIMQADGLTTFERALPLRDFQAALAAKLVEEAREAAASGTRAELVEELADVAEVILALTAAHGIDAAEIEAARIAKRAARGGFDGRVWNDAVAAPEGCPALDYYLARRHAYPQEGE
ncbi:nucleoside triphosphate pyrophosphohydrolase [Caulobacter sp. KR2-114]|uniref:nucleoside triphosphate pyrophosphohydrolase n=1 Tax=Caulobacter sp. KR2-114 TaxID=3400912 RepID=UPI003C00D8AB